MVGYSDPCPWCSNKRKRSPLERSESLPAPRSPVLVTPPPNKLARSISDPLTSSATAQAILTSLAVTPQPQLAPKPSASAGFLGSSAAAAAASISAPSATTVPLMEVDAGRQKPASEPKEIEKIAKKVPSKAVSCEKEKKGSSEGSEKVIDAQVSSEEMNGKKEEKDKEKAAAEMKPRTIAAVKMSKGVHIKITFKCKCGACQEVVLN